MHQWAFNSIKKGFRNSYSYSQYTKNVHYVYNFDCFFSSYTKIYNEFKEILESRKVYLENLPISSKYEIIIKLYRF